MAARRKRKGSTKVPFALKDRKMVQDLEEVQYDDVVQMAIQRLVTRRYLDSLLGDSAVTTAVSSF